MCELCFVRLESRYSRKGSSVQGICSTEFSMEYDYVLVFKMVGDGENKKQSDIAKYFISVLKKHDFKVFSYLSVQKDELIVLLKPSLEKLQKFADRINFELELDPHELKATIESDQVDEYGNVIIQKRVISHDRSITPREPYINIFGDYKIDRSMQKYYPKSLDESKGPFSKIQRLQLVIQMLQAPTRDGGCDLMISKMRHLKKILACYPLHDRVITDRMQAEITSWWSLPWNISFYDIKEYFGEKIALYYVFMAHYSYWLIFPSIVGFAFQQVIWGTVNFSSPVLPFYSLIMPIWGMVMLEYWKRENNAVSLVWGTSDFEEKELDRPEYVGREMKSFIDGSNIVWFSPAEARMKYRRSRGVIIAFLALICGVVAAIYVLRYELSQPIGSYASTVASILNTIQITVCNIIYQSLAYTLTDAENHRTDTLFEDALIVKMFVFQFINSYSSFFFLAFIAAYLEQPPGTPSNWVGQCGASDCMQSLSINLAIIFGSRLTLTNCWDIFYPYWNYKKKIAEETKGVNLEATPLSPAEKDYMLMEYDPIVQSVNNYADAAVQYGFSMLFVAALPIATFFSLFSNYVKLKFNAWKLMTFYQRPLPSRAQNIGTWEPIFDIITVVAVVTNSALVCYTMEVFHGFTIYGRTWVFIGYQWILFGLQYAISILIPDESEEINIQKKRQQFIVSKVIEKKPDDLSNHEEAEDPMMPHEYEEALKKITLSERIFRFVFPATQGKHMLKKIDPHHLVHDAVLHKYPHEQQGNKNPLNSIV